MYLLVEKHYVWFSLILFPKKFLNLYAFSGPLDGCNPLTVLLPMKEFNIPTYICSTHALCGMKCKCFIKNSEQLRINETDIIILLLLFVSIRMVSSSRIAWLMTVLSLNWGVPSDTTGQLPYLSNRSQAIVLCLNVTKYFICFWRIYYLRLL